MKRKRPYFFFFIIMGCLLLVSCHTTHKVTPSYSTEVISVQSNTHLGNWSISNQDLKLNTGPWSVEQIRLTGGKQEGVDLIKVNNGVLQFTVIPTRGMSIFDVQCGGVRLGWDSPVKEMVNPAFIRLEDHNGLGWLEGFNEWMVRCGIEFSGHPGMDGDRMLTLHGKIGNTPAYEVQVVIDEYAPHRIRIRGRVDERMFNGAQLELWTEISTVPGSNSFRLEDVITNKGKNDQEMMILYHANFGPPLLEKGSQLVGTIKKVVPFNDIAAKDVQKWNTYDVAKDGKPEQVYCIYPMADKDGQVHFLFHNKSGDKGVSFHYPKEQLPYFTQWKNENTGGYVTGLEPGTGFPHNRSVERKYGRVPILKPEESRNFSIEYTIHNNKEQINRVKNKIERLQEKPAEVNSIVIKK